MLAGYWEVSSRPARASSLRGATGSKLYPEVPAPYLQRRRSLSMHIGILRVSNGSSWHPPSGGRDQLGLNKWLTAKSVQDEIIQCFV
jgi:hypothetical protein